MNPTLELVNDTPTNDTPAPDAPAAPKTTVLTVTESAFVKMVFEEYQALVSQAEKHRNARLAALLHDHPATGQVTFAENAEGRVVMTDTDVAANG